MATQPAAQRRAEAKVMYDAFVATCPTRQVLAMIGDKWVGLTVAALSNGPMRHGQLRARIAGASQKMLTQTLRLMERDGLVTRTVTPTVPLRVDYELTALGRTLVPVLTAVKEWSETHIAEIMAARDAYEARTSS
ncbi:winged helix-turn-helix transcriptional regulator [Actinocrispum wychmicini]|uniref:HxlR family transcriptional regulator n=1 Tax=Actinocrispum wychmicini TaxID=1213861 RepID=A0A4R2ITZ0_9PSEU|nr:helix-turn-helix domain-containing protein [Actinocrispum wychmicini]TCO48082.1 HxlR family transcriptional regulator [Actinocrispum wychmicini]